MAVNPRPKLFETKNKLTHKLSKNAFWFDITEFKEIDNIVNVTLNNGKHYFDVAKQKDYLKELDGKAIQIVIDINMYRHWEFFAMPVIGTELNKIRRRLGLPYKDDFHVTIGRLHPNAKRLGLLTKEINEL